MTGNKCYECGLTNYASATSCRRCEAPLGFPRAVDAVPVEAGEVQEKSSLKKIILKSALRISVVVGFILFVCYATLLSTSEPVLLEQKDIVFKAIDVIEQKGFSREAFVLRHMVFYRSTDNWWNRKVGHAGAYAATNFPFEVVTLYPSFFLNTTDDVERASVLLHEAHHLLGRGEERAYEEVWRNKRQLGWTKEKYAHTVVWNNVITETAQYVPELFQCGQDKKSDCIE
jgi:hypothetical protein